MHSLDCHCVVPVHYMSYVSNMQQFYYVFIFDVIDTFNSFGKCPKDSDPTARARPKYSFNGLAGNSLQAPEFFQDSSIIFIGPMKGIVNCNPSPSCTGEQPYVCLVFLCLTPMCNLLCGFSGSQEATFGNNSICMCIQDTCAL